MQNVSKKKVKNLALKRSESLAKYLFAIQAKPDIELSNKSVSNQQAFRRIIDDANSDRVRIDDVNIQKILLNTEKIALGSLNGFDLVRLTDQDEGHWDLYSEQNLDDSEENVVFEWKTELYERNPIQDVVDTGIVAIDFGTKSTVAGYLDRKLNKQLIRIGTSSVNREVHSKDYENPTVMEFVDLQTFWKDYCSSVGRPLTNWNDLPISHTAENNLKNATQEKFYSFFNRLKQWANDDGRQKILLEDQQGFNTELEHLISSQEGDINPIEIYAYYIGRHINSMESNRGIYLQYYLSYPVKYRKDVREKIRESFERGLKKSIPSSVFKSGKELRVELRASEPAAYAISALQEYGFYNANCPKTYYGVFDFGGGTTDFDFGVWKKSERKRYDFDIHHFGADGDEFLGGENLLEALAYLIFKQNAALMKKESCSFPPVKLLDDDIFAEKDSLVRNSVPARKNLIEVVKILRPWWENLEDFGEKDIGELKPYLMKNDLTSKDIKLDYNIAKLRGFLIERIERGVENFFSAFENTFHPSDRNIQHDIDILHIFLGGNSSRSILVKQAFEKKIAELQKKHKGLKFELYPPLGTPEAMEKIQTNGKKDGDLSNFVTCKTGVVFGLLDGRTSGKIQVISEIGSQSETKFVYHLGGNQMNKFVPIILRDKIEIGNTYLFEDDCAGLDEFELYYTREARATDGNLDVNGSGVLNRRFKLKTECREGDRIEIQIKSINTIKYYIYAGNEIREESEEIRLDD